MSGMSRWFRFSFPCIGEVGDLLDLLTFLTILTPSISRGLEVFEIKKVKGVTRPRMSRWSSPPRGESEPSRTGGR